MLSISAKNTYKVFNFSFRISMHIKIVTYSLITQELLINILIGIAWIK